jgi:hypothetical protein
MDELIVDNVLGAIRFLESQPPSGAPRRVLRSRFPHHDNLQLLPRRDFSKILGRKNNLPALADRGFKLDSFHGDNLRFHNGIGRQSAQNGTVYLPSGSTRSRAAGRQYTMTRVLAVIVLGLFLTPSADASWFRRKPKAEKVGPARYGLSKREQNKEAKAARKRMNRRARR